MYNFDTFTSFHGFATTEDDRPPVSWVAVSRHAREYVRMH